MEVITLRCQCFILVFKPEKVKPLAILGSSTAQVLTLKYKHIVGSKCLTGGIKISASDQIRSRRRFLKYESLLIFLSSLNVHDSVIPIQIFTLFKRTSLNVKMLKHSVFKNCLQCKQCICVHLSHDLLDSYSVFVSCWNYGNYRILLQAV